MWMFIQTIIELNCVGRWHNSDYLRENLGQNANYIVHYILLEASPTF